MLKWPVVQDLLNATLLFQKADLHGEGRISVDEYFEILASNNIQCV